MPAIIDPRRNVGTQLVYVFGSHTALIVSVSLAVLALVAACLRPEGRGRAAGWLLRVNFLCIGWMALVLAPFVWFSYGAVRFSAALSIPMGLLLASYADLFWRVWGRRRPERKLSWTPLAKCVFLTLGADGSSDLADHALVASFFEPAKADRWISRDPKQASAGP